MRIQYLDRWLDGSCPSADTLPSYDTSRVIDVFPANRRKARAIPTDHGPVSRRRSSVASMPALTGSPEVLSRAPTPASPTASIRRLSIAEQSPARSTGAETSPTVSRRSSHTGSQAEPAEALSNGQVEPIGASVIEADARSGSRLAIIKHRHTFAPQSIRHSWLVAFPMGAAGEALSKSSLKCLLSTCTLTISA